MARWGEEVMSAEPSLLLKIVFGDRQQELDAKDVLLLQEQLAAQPKSGFAIEHINTFLTAGAATEVQNALELRFSEMGEEPYIGAVEIEVGCWDPSTRVQALEMSEEWLALHAGSSLDEYVTVRRDWLNTEVAHLQKVDHKQVLARSFPGMAFLAALLLCWLGFRALLRWAK